MGLRELTQWGIGGKALRKQFAIKTLKGWSQGWSLFFLTGRWNYLELELGWLGQRGGYLLQGLHTALFIHTVGV